MISLTCTSCRTVLTIDDAFAGGVCRCRHCGTIQTVPSHLKRAGAGAGPGAGAGMQKPAKTLYQNERVGAVGTGGKNDSGIRIGTGLDELAEIVASSGLGGSGLTSNRLRGSAASSHATPASPPPRSLTPWLAGAGVVIVILLALVLWLSLRASAPSTSLMAQTSSNPDQVAAAASFCGVRLNGNVVAYVLDRGNGSRETFDALKEATCRSIESLGPDRKFQVIFWSNGERDENYPAGLPAYATRENIASCRRALDDVIAFGQTDPESAIRKALAGRADTIVLVTGKGLELDDAFAQRVLGTRGSNKARIDTIALGESSSPVLQEIAKRTGGQYQTLPAAKLRTFIE